MKDWDPVSLAFILMFAFIAGTLVSIAVSLERLVNLFELTS